MEYDPEDPHEVAARRADLAAQAIADAARADAAARPYLRAAAALQATAAFYAETADRPELRRAVDNALASGVVSTFDAATAEGVVALPPTTRALSAAFETLKTEARENRVDLSRVVRESVVSL